MMKKAPAPRVSFQASDCQTPPITWVWFHSPEKPFLASILVRFQAFSNWASYENPPHMIRPQTRSQRLLRPPAA